MKKNPAADALFSKHLFAWLFLGSLSSAQALEVTPVFRQEAGFFSPLMTTFQNTLVFTDGPSSLVRLLNAQTGVESMSLPTRGHHVSLQSSSRGDVALCDTFGNHLKVFSLLSGDTQELDFDNTERNCSQATFEEVKGSVKSIWMGSVGDRSVYELNAATLKTRRTYTGLSGPTSVKKVGGFIFSMSGIVSNAIGNMPLILNAATGKVVVGNAEGDVRATPLKREYLDEIVVDQPSQSVFYISPGKQALLRFDSKAPTVAGATVIGTSGIYPWRLDRVGSCFVILGSTESTPRKAMLKVIRLESNSSGTNVGTLREETIDPRDLPGIVDQAITASGDVFVSHKQGIVRVRGLFDGLDCRDSHTHK